MKIKIKKKAISSLTILYGGARGIRTLAPVTRSTSLAGKPLEPLEYYSTYQVLFYYNLLKSTCQFKIETYKISFNFKTISLHISGLFAKNSLAFSRP